MKRDAIVIKAQDNVATALRDIEADETVGLGTGDEVTTVQVGEFIPYGHKFSLKLIKQGDDIVKYGEIIGRATQDIPAGMHAHIQNIESLRGRGDLNS